MVAVGIEPNTQLAHSARLETDPEIGGFQVNSELQACTDVWAVSYCCRFVTHTTSLSTPPPPSTRPGMSLPSSTLTSAADVWSTTTTPRSAGGLLEPTWRATTSSLSTSPCSGVTWGQTSVLRRPDWWTLNCRHLGYTRGRKERWEASCTSLSLPILPTFALHSSSLPLILPLSIPQEAVPVDDYSKGVVFYLNRDERRIVGVLTWNLFGKMDVARKVCERQELCGCGLSY